MQAFTTAPISSSNEAGRDVGTVLYWTCVAFKRRRYICHRIKVALTGNQTANEARAAIVVRVLLSMVTGLRLQCGTRRMLKSVMRVCRLVYHQTQPVLRVSMVKANASMLKGQSGF